MLKIRNIRSSLRCSSILLRSFTFKEIVVPRFNAPVGLSFNFKRHFSSSTPLAFENMIYLKLMKFRPVINLIIREFSEDTQILKEVEAKHITKDSWINFLGSFRRKLIKSFSGSSELESFLNEIEPDINRLSFTGKVLEVITRDSLSVQDAELLDDIKSKFLKLVIKNAEIDLEGSIFASKALSKCADLTLPHDWYPFARILKRKIYYHGGPTNSGKTYQALQRLKNADPQFGGGLYCGPLRLLALEIFEKLNKEGVHCNLLTGQEHQEVPFATHQSSTVEMVSLDKPYDVVVIDEIQMIADDSRGWAWTRVLQGLHAREIHVCGGLEVLDVVQELVKAMGDEFVIQKYERLSSLRIDDESLQGDYSKIEPGDCIVAFNRSDIFSIRKQVEKLTKHKCAIIYGQLPPEIRSQQARLFNEGQVDVLVASDAIGMGLNLNIRRIIFHSTVKSGGRQGGSYFVEPSQVKQIAGRAGRLSSQYKEGIVTAWQNLDLAYVKAVMGIDVPQAKAAGLLPTVSQIEKFSTFFRDFSEKLKKDMENSSQLSEDDQMAHEEDHIIEEARKSFDINNIELSYLMDRFVEASKTSGRYFVCQFDSLTVISNWLHSIPLSLEDRFTFANAPVNIRDSDCMNMLYSFASTYSLRRPVALNVRLSATPPRSFIEFQLLCVKHTILDLYLWLSFRFPKFFVERDLCLEQQAFCQQLIKDTLFGGTLHQEYSHSESYRRLRPPSRDINDYLPPVDWGNVRDLTRMHLEKYPSNTLVKLPFIGAEVEKHDTKNDRGYRTMDSKSNNRGFSNGQSFAGGNGRQQGFSGNVGSRVFSRSSNNSSNSNRSSSSSSSSNSSSGSNSSNGKYDKNRSNPKNYTNTNQSGRSNQRKDNNVASSSSPNSSGTRNTTSDKVSDIMKIKF